MAWTFVMRWSGEHADQSMYTPLDRLEAIDANERAQGFLDDHHRQAQRPKVLAVGPTGSGEDRQYAVQIYAQFAQ